MSLLSDVDVDEDINRDMISWMAGIYLQPWTRDSKIAFFLMTVLFSLNTCSAFLTLGLPGDCAD